MSSHNNYNYTVIKNITGTDGELSNHGFESGRVNKDNTLMIVDKRDSVKETIANDFVPSKPGYVSESFPNWPHLNHDEARQLMVYSDWNVSNKVV